MAEDNALMRIHLLGPLQIEIQDRQQSLPRSKKTRALLAYLILSSRKLRRDALCDMFWDVTDDPKGALRWSLSRLRREIAWDRDRIQASRQDVYFNREGAFIDALELARFDNNFLKDASTEALETASQIPQGMFLEELELPDTYMFNSWCLGQREQFRNIRCAILFELIRRLADQPDCALSHARTLTDLDPFNVQAQIALLKVLNQLGYAEEARKRYDNCRRLFKDLGAAGMADIHQAWLRLQQTPPKVASLPAAEPAPPGQRPVWGNALPFVGRERELAQLEQVLADAGRDGHPAVFLYQGEPGIGKTRLAERLRSRAENAGFMVFSGRAYEAESRSPYKPWLDALDIRLNELLPETGIAGEIDQDALFRTVTDRLATLAQGRGVVITLDDLQWFDSVSLQLLHFVARSYRKDPLVIGLFARSGELLDNAAAQKTLRGLRQQVGARVFDLEPLSSDEILALAGHLEREDGERIYRSCAGNPLYAIELARAGGEAGKASPKSLVKLVRERVERLPDNAIEVIQWGAVLGRSISIPRIEALCSIDREGLVEALECLENHALFRIDAGQLEHRYRFSHDVVRQAVYTDMSLPRRRLMHRKVVELLGSQLAESEVATEVAYHAGLCGEALIGAKACLVAGQQALRVFANGDAENFARQGLQLTEQLQGKERIALKLELLHLLYSARQPDRAQAGQLLGELAEQALAAGMLHEARLGFQMLSFLRWESASMAAAHSNILQAERISRDTEPPERAAALAQAAKCFLLLERNLNQAEAFILEVKGLIANRVKPFSTAYFAEGMLAVHRGQYEQAGFALQEAMYSAHLAGEYLNEFAALEQRVMLGIDRNQLFEGAEQATLLAELGERLREGVEGPASRALQALMRLLSGDQDATLDLQRAVDALKEQDAKYQLAFIFTRWASYLLKQHQIEPARAIAGQALAVSTVIGRPSEIAISNAILLRCAEANRDGDGRKQYLQNLTILPAQVSHAAQLWLNEVLPG